MRFELTDDQQQIKRTARELLADRYPPGEIRRLAESERGFTDEQWSELAELGWAGLALAEEAGGQGLGLVELASIAEEIGYAAAPTPLLAHTAAALAAEAFGAGPDVVGPLASGERRAALVAPDPSGRSGPGVTITPSGDGDGALVSGSQFPVEAAASAELLVVVARDRVALIDTAADGVTVERVATIDATRKQAHVLLEDVPVAADALLRADARAWPGVRDRLLVVLAAGLVGTCQRAMERAVSYAGERHQFGKPIGIHQGVSHRCAQMLLETEGARSLTYYAAWAAEAEPETLPSAAAMAKAYASDAGPRVCESSLQVHGGIGFTWEDDLQFWLKRARADAAAMGGASAHRARLAELARI
ncbi:MAG: acyl-CoA dehydrogenase family protein [Solirubrobacterales bacterium]